MQPSHPSMIEALVIGDGELLRALNDLSRDVPFSAQFRPLPEAVPTETLPHVYFVCVPTRDTRRSFDHVEQLAARPRHIPIIAWMEGEDEETALGALERGADEVLSAAVGTAASVRSAIRRARARAQRRLWRTTLELRDFSSRVAHGLQSPIARISSFKDVASRLSDFSKATDPDVPSKPVDLNVVIRSVMDGMSDRLRDGSSQILIRELPTVRARPGSMEQLFGNLVDNALKFGATGVPPRVEIGSARAPEGWRLWVSDQGRGIEPGDMESFFGQGLGLHICRRIVESHGGRLWADSEPGRGACFYFTLPIS